MLEEEKELRKLSPLFATQAGRKEYRDAITALVRAVREDCAKVAEEEAQRLIHSGPDDDGGRFIDEIGGCIAAAIRGKK